MLPQAKDTLSVDRNGRLQLSRSYQCL